MKTLMAMLCVLALCVGCGDGQPRPKVDARATAVETVVKLGLLPEGASDIRGEGADWVSFSLERDGVKHRYLYKALIGRSRENQPFVRTDTITRMD